MADDDRRANWPPNYADPIVLRLRFVPHARKEKYFPTQIATGIGYSDAELFAALERTGVIPAADQNWGNRVLWWPE